MAGGGAGGAGRGQDVVTHVGVSAGPGSFTGLRVGMAAAKGFCFGWGLPIVPVPTLHALASRFPSGEALVCPVLDAKKKEVYAGVFRWEGGGCIRVRPDAAVPPSALPDWFPEGKVFFCGDGTVPFEALFRARMGARALFPPPGEGLPRASAVGLLAERVGRGGGAGRSRLSPPPRGGDRAREVTPCRAGKIDNCLSFVTLNYHPRSGGADGGAEPGRENDRADRKGSGVENPGSGTPHAG